MGKIKITHDDNNVYAIGQVMEIKKLIEDFCDCSNDESLNDWLYAIPIPSAMKFIADAWGLDYEFV